MSVARTDRIAVIGGGITGLAAAWELLRAGQQPVVFEADTRFGGKISASPFGGLPVLEVGEQVVSQSNAINRYVGKLGDLYPSDPWQAALCDEIMEAVEDITNKIGATLFIPEEQKKVQRKELAEGPIPFYLTRLQQRLEAHGGRYFSADRLTVADLKVFVWIRHLKSGVLDHMPADLPDRIATKLVEHYERVKNEPGVTAYYARHGSEV